MLVNDSGSLSLLDHSLDVSALFLFFDLFFDNCIGLDFLLSEFNIILLKIPLLERSSIYLDNRILDKSFGSDQFVVGGIVNNVQNSGLLGEIL